MAEGSAWVRCGHRFRWHPLAQNLWKISYRESTVEDGLAASTVEDGLALTTVEPDPSLFCTVWLVCTHVCVMCVYARVCM